MTTEEKLKHFEDASLKRAREQSEQILSDYRASLEQLEEEHKAMKRRQADLIIQTETLSLKRAENMALSKERLKIRRELIKRHDELKDKLFAEVQTLLEDYKKTPAYEELLQKQIREIINFADGGEVTIYIDPADADKIPALVEVVPAPMTISAYSFGGGTRAVIDANHILIDNSFETILAEEKEKFTFDGGNIHG